MFALRIKKKNPHYIFSTLALRVFFKYSRYVFCSKLLTLRLLLKNALVTPLFKNARTTCFLNARVDMQTMLFASSFQN